MNNIHVVSRAVVIDQGQILLCKTLDRPANFYFLPGGHVEYGESLETALLRELVEEAGAKCRIKRFLGCLEHTFEPGYSSRCHNHEYNFIYEVESDTLKVGSKLLHLEKHIQLVWMPLNKIGEIDFRAEPFRSLIPEWLKLQPTKAFKSVMSWPSSS